MQKEARKLAIIANSAKDLIVNAMLKLGKPDHKISEITGVKVEPLNSEIKEIVAAVLLGTADLTAKQEIRRSQMESINEQVQNHRQEKTVLDREQSFQYSYAKKVRI